MKTVVIILLMWAGTLSLPCRAGTPEQKDCENRLSGITVFTDLGNGIRFLSPNAGFTYRFHPQWSISAETGLSLEGWLLEDNPELAGHNEALQWPGEHEGREDGKKKEHRKALPLQSSKFQLEWWPFPGKWTGYLDGCLRWDHRSAPEFRLGLGWDISITRHWILKLEISAAMNDVKNQLNDCMTIKLGYHF